MEVCDDTVVFARQDSSWKYTIIDQSPAVINWFVSLLKLGRNLLHARLIFGRWVTIPQKVLECRARCLPELFRCRFRCFMLCEGIYSTLKVISLDQMWPPGPHWTFGLLVLSARICFFQRQLVWFLSRYDSSELHSLFDFSNVKRGLTMML